MKLDGKKSKTGALICTLSSISFLFSVFEGIPISIAIGAFLFALSIAVFMFGIYDRTVKNHKTQVSKLEEIRGRIKKPAIM